MIRAMAVDSDFEWSDDDARRRLLRGLRAAGSSSRPGPRVYPSHRSRRHIRSDGRYSESRSSSGSAGSSRLASSSIACRTSSRSSPNAFARSRWTAADRLAAYHPPRVARRPWSQQRIALPNRKTGASHDPAAARISVPIRLALLAAYLPGLCPAAVQPRTAEAQCCVGRITKTFRDHGGPQRAPALDDLQRQLTTKPKTVRSPGRWTSTPRQRSSARRLSAVATFPCLRCSSFLRQRPPPSAPPLPRRRVRRRRRAGRLFPSRRMRRRGSALGPSLPGIHCR